MYRTINAGKTWEGVDGGRLYEWVGPSQTKVMQIMKVSMWETAVCAGTLFFLFYSVLLLYVGGPKSCFPPSSFKNQPPVEKVRWRATRFQFFPRKKGQKQPSVSPTHQHGFRIQDNRKTYSQEKGAEGRKKQETNSDFAEKVHFCRFRNYFSKKKMTRPSSHPNPCTV